MTMTKKRSICLGQTIPHRPRPVDINPDDSDDAIQEHILKYLSILRFREGRDNCGEISSSNEKQNCAKSKVFWETILQFSLSTLNKTDDNITNNFFRNTFWKNGFPSTRKSETWFNLHCASAYSSISEEHLKILCLASVKSNIKTNKLQAPVTKDTPMHLASVAPTPNINIIQCLHKYFPRMVHTTNGEGNLPLHYAARYSKNINIINLLIKLNPNSLEQSNKKGRTPLFSACMNSSQEVKCIFDTMLQASPKGIKHIDKYGNSLLHFAVNYNNSLHNQSSSQWIEIIQTLLTTYPEAASITNSDGNTPLHLACISNHHEHSKNIIQLLIQYNLAATITMNNEHLTPLTKLLEYYDNDDDNDDEGWRQNRKDITCLLIDSNPESVAIPNHQGAYPLHIAIDKQLDDNIIEKIIKSYPNAMTISGGSKGCTPFMHAITNDRSEAILTDEDVLKRLQYLYKRCPEVIKIKSLDNGNTALHNAASGTCCKLVEYIYNLDKSAILTINNDGNTPLHIAANNIAKYPPIDTDKCEYFSFLLRKCPQAAIIRNSDALTPYDILYNSIAKGNKYNWKHLQRLLLLFNPKDDTLSLLKSLQYESRRMAMFIFFSAVSEDDLNNIFNRLKDAREGSYLIRKIVLYL